MFKKCIALLLAVVLLLGVVPQVSAARIENRVVLSPYAFTDDDNVYREFTNSGSPSITMVPGEWFVTPAFHAVDGWVASYSGLSAVSSNPDVVEAKVVRVGAVPVPGVANSFVGLQVHAKKTGTARITVSYATFVTNSKYEDRRGTPYSTKTFDVTVTGQALEMSVSMSSGAVTWDWPEGVRDAEKYFNEGMAEANELLASKMLIDGITAVVTSGTIAAGYGAAIATGVTMFVPGGALAMAVAAVGLSVGLAVRTQMELAKGNKNAVKDAADETKMGIAMEIEEEIREAWLPGGKTSIPVGDMLDIAEIGITYLEADILNRLRENTYPTAYPGSTKVMIRLTNNSDKDVTATLQLSSENLSFTSEYGPWADSYSGKYKTVTVPGNGRMYADITVYAKPGFHTGGTGISELIHTGSVAVQCEYYDEALGQNVTLDGGTELPVYSKLNKQDQVKAAQALLNSENKRASYIMCPVDVHILDKEGNTLAVLTTGGESYQDEFITAGSVDDMKYFMIPQDKKDDYQLKIVAVEDGTMHVVGMDGGAATNMSGYSDVPLKKGDTFFLDVAGSEPAALYMVSSDGSRKAVDAVLQINEDKIAEELKKTDVSKENRGVIAHAMARALVPAEVRMESYQTEITLEQLARMMLNLLEKQLDMYPGKLTQLYLEENPEAEPVSLPVAVAAWKGLLTREYEETAFQEDAASRMLTREELQMMHDSFRDMMELPEYLDFVPDTMTFEQVICMVDALWKAKAVEGRNVELTSRTVEEIREELTTATSYEDDTLYYNPDKPIEHAICDVMIYEPTRHSAVMSQSEVEADVMSRIRTLMSLNDYAADSWKFVDMNALNNGNVSLCIGFLGSGFECVDDQGWYYSWVPFYFSKDGKNIHQNKVYLAVYRGYEAADAMYIVDQEDLENNDNRMECYIITDQETVGSFLATQNLLKQAVEVKYTTLQTGSEGDAVYMMQERLMGGGFYEGELSGKYDAQTAKAVRDAQTALNLSATGVADEIFLKTIYGEMTTWDMPLEKWLKPHREKLEQEKSIP